MDKEIYKETLLGLIRPGVRAGVLIVSGMTVAGTIADFIIWQNPTTPGYNFFTPLVAMLLSSAVGSAAAGYYAGHVRKRYGALYGLQAALLAVVLLFIVLARSEDWRRGDVYFHFFLIAALLFDLILAMMAGWIGSIRSKGGRELGTS